MTTFKKINRSGVVLYTIPSLNNKNVEGYFTTKHGGVSKGYLSSMNMSFTRGDIEKNVIENYTILSDAIGFDYNKFAFSYQIHTDQVHKVTKDDLGIEYSGPDKLFKADALITNEKGISLIKHSADCTIVYLYDPKNQAIGLVHSGWKSTVLNIAKKTVVKMNKEYTSNPSDLICAIAPCIGECCFEVGNAVSDKFEAVFKKDAGVVSYEYNKPHVNLEKACEIQLLESGVKKENITKASLCTACNTETFFSHRKENGKCGLSVGTLTLKKN